MFLKRLFFCVNVLIALVSFSCRSDLDEFVEEKDVMFEASSRSMESDEDESTIYPKGVIPDWVLNILSEESIEKIKELSAEFEIRYYRVSKRNTQGLNVVDSSEYVLSKEDSVEYFLADSQIARVKSSSEGGGDGGDEGEGIGGGEDFGEGNVGGGGAGESDDITMESQTNTFATWGILMGKVYVDVSVAYLYDKEKDVAVDVIGPLNVNLDYSGFYWGVYWEHRAGGVLLIEDGKKLQYHINGRIKGRIVFEGLVGLDFTMKSIYNTRSFEVIPGYNDDWF